MSVAVTNNLNYSSSDKRTSQTHKRRSSRKLQTARNIKFRRVHRTHACNMHLHTHTHTCIASHVHKYKYTETDNTQTSSERKIHAVCAPNSIYSSLSCLAHTSIRDRSCCSCWCSLPHLRTCVCVSLIRVDVCSLHIDTLKMSSLVLNFNC